MLIVLCGIPELKGKKVILYAPTFRDKELVDFDLHLNIDECIGLKDEYILVIKLHPAIRKICNYKETYKDFYMTIPYIQI